MFTKLVTDALSNSLPFGVWENCKGSKQEYSMNRKQRRDYIITKH